MNSAAPAAQWEKLLDGRFDSKHPRRTLWNLFSDQRARVFGATFLFIIKQSPGSLLPLAVAHRFSTIRHAHRIIVLQKGKIVEQGTHAELLARDGQFSRLAQLQTVQPVEAAK